MSCERFEESLWLHAAGELDEASARAVERHLQECAACREELEGLRSLIAELGGSKNVPLRNRELYAQQVLRKIRQDRFPARRWVLRLSPAFALGLLLLAGLEIRRAAEEREIIANLELLENLEALEKMELEEEAKP